jgi:hypothetical protein
LAKKGGGAGVNWKNILFAIKAFTSVVDDTRPSQEKESEIIVKHYSFKRANVIKDITLLANKYFYKRALEIFWP